jgi:alpha-L-rhamnosidase-like protein
MLEAGATTWWEQFGGYASLCHAWSTAPTADLSDNVLGVKLTEPAFAAFRVEPHPADLTWAKGVVPTPRGDVAVNWKRDGSKFELNVAVPMQALVELSVPAKNLETSRLTSKTRSQKREFTDGRARYWVQAPGTFRIEAEG